MQSNSYFIIPLCISYLIICALWFLINSKTNWWPAATIKTSESPQKDLIIGLLAAIGILGVGQLYSAGFLLPETNDALTNRAIWMLNNVVIFSPIFITLWIRKHDLSTILISGKKAHIKLLFGLLASLLGITLFLGLRNEWSRIPLVFAKAVEIKSISYFPAVFFENLALAFLFVRLKWVVGIKWAITIPSLLFALAHVPGSTAEGDSLSHIVTFFFLTGGLTTIILYTTYRSRDILWLGVVHYMMDIVIQAF